MSWSYSQAPGRDLPDAGWASAATASRDELDAGWAMAPTACRDAVLGGQLYTGIGVDLDALGGTGTTVSASGWTLTISGACRDE